MMHIHINQRIHLLLNGERKQLSPSESAQHVRSRVETC